MICQARIANRTFPLESQNQHTRYPALEFGVNGAHQFTTASVSSQAGCPSGF